MPSNRGVVYTGPGKVSVESIDYPELVLRPGPGVPPINENRPCPHGVILKVVASNICGSDQHMVRGRTTAPPGLVLGHEITGEVVETAATSSTARSATWSRCRSTWRVAAAATASSGAPTSA